MPSTMDPPATLFINYRRNDSDAWADRLLEILIPEFSSEHIFLDIDGSTPAGFNWQHWIDQRVATCDLMLVLIGPHWGEEFARRSDPATRDYVRLEIERALAHEIPVVPVLLGDASLPSGAALPASLRSLLEMEALHLGRGDRFRADAEKLIGAVLSSIERSRTQKAVRRANRQPSFALQKLERNLLLAGMPAVDVEATRSALAGCSDYLEQGGAAGIHFVAASYKRVPDFADGVDTEKAISALNEWLAEVNTGGEQGQFGYVGLSGKLSSSWVFVDWRGDVIADRDSAILARILRPALFATGSRLECHTPGKVLAGRRDVSTDHPAAAPA
jgi:TIR domain